MATIANYTDEEIKKFYAYYLQKNITREQLLDEIIMLLPQKKFETRMTFAIKGENKK